MLRKAISLVAAFVMLFTIFGCAGTSQEIRIDTPEKKYLAARMELNKTIKSYLAHKTMLPPEEQAALSEKYGEYFYQADLALDSWGKIVVGGELGDPVVAESAFLTIKQQLFSLLISEGIIEVEVQQ